eukprot:scaffold37620_cov64-Phaeocystis_antarctica.AAC.3
MHEEGATQDLTNAHTFLVVHTGKASALRNELGHLERAGVRAESAKVKVGQRVGETSRASEEQQRDAGCHDWRDHGQGGAAAIREKGETRLGLRRRDALRLAPAGACTAPPAQYAHQPCRDGGVTDVRGGDQATDCDAVCGTVKQRASWALELPVLQVRLWLAILVSLPANPRLCALPRPGMRFMRRPGLQNGRLRGDDGHKWSLKAHVVERLLEDLTARVLPPVRAHDDGRRLLLIGPLNQNYVACI